MGGRTLDLDIPIWDTDVWWAPVYAPVSLFVLFYGKKPLTFQIGSGRSQMVGRRLCLATPTARLSADSRDWVLPRTQLYAVDHTMNCWQALFHSLTCNRYELDLFLGLAENKKD